MATSLTHKYIPRINQTEENLFVEEYYSSTDTKIYIDDIEQTEISYINYALQEQLKPLYGYSSRTFDDVAIGSRIVTGTLKVSVKNPEAQSSLDDILQRSKSPNLTIEDYNNSQQEIKDTIEWISIQSNPNINDLDIQEDDGTFEYRTKLINLGYDLDYNSSPAVLSNAIKKFQKEHNIGDGTGILDADTINAIDSELNHANLDTMTIPSGTKIYYGPSYTFDVIETTSYSQEVYILDNDYDNGWIYIMTKDGTEGYINKNKI